MADAVYDIRINQKGATAAASGFGKAGNAAHRMESQFASAAAGMLAAGGIIAAMSKVTQFAEKAAKTETMAKAFDAMAKKAGLSVGTLDRLRRATGGTVEEMDLLRLSNNALLLGLASTEDQFAELFEISRKLGRALGLDTAQAVESLVTGLGRQSIAMLDNLGIMVRADDAYKKFADSLNKTVSELTAVERKTAFLNDAMTQSRKKVGELGEQDDDLAESGARVSVAFDNAGKSIGGFLDPFLKLMNSTSAQGAELVSFIFDLGSGAAFQSGGFFDSQGAAMNSVWMWGEGFKDVRENAIPVSASMEEISLEAFNQAAAMKNLGDVVQYVGAGWKEQHALAIQQYEDTRAISEGVRERIRLEESRLALIDSIMLRERELLQIRRDQKDLLKEGLDEAASDEEKKQRAVDFELRYRQQQYAETERNRRAQVRLASDTIGSIAAMNVAFKGSAEATRRLAQMQAVIDTYAAANAAYKAMAGIPVVGPGLAVVAAAAAIAQGLANVSMIEQQKFAQGGSFETTGPATISTGTGRYLVGDNPGGRERVDVTPTSSRGSRSPGGTNITLQFLGPITNEDYVRDVIAPAVKEAQRSA